MNIKVKERVLQINMGQVPKGYKKTKAGIIPDEWNLKKLGSIALINKKQLSENTVSNYKFYYIDIGCVEAGKIKYSAKPILFKNAPSRARRKVNINDIIMSTVRPNLKAFAYIRDERNNLICSTGFSVLSEKKEISLSKYIFYNLFSYQSEKYYFACVVGSNYPALNNSDVRKLPIPIPSLSEQQKIAEILSTCDKVIELKEKLIEQKKLQKKYLMQVLLDPKSPYFRRLIGFKGEWQEVNLEDISEITTGKLDANAMTENGDYKFFTCAKESYLINKYAFDTEALLVSGNGANVGYVHYYKGKFNAYQRTYVLDKFKQNIILIKYMLDIFLKARIHKEKNEGNTPYIRLDTLGKMKIKLPLSIEQKSIVNVLSAADQEISLLEKELEQQKLKKKALMQLLLTGKVRVNVS